MTDVSIPAAALAGVISFPSPCVLPLVPGYLAFVPGTSIVDDSGRPTASLSHISVRAVAFVLGFTTIFVLLGASATQLGTFLVSRAPLFSKLAGLVIVVFGLHLLGAAPGAGYLARFLARFRRFYRAVEVTSGLLLIAIGVLIFSGRFTWLSANRGGNACQCDRQRRVSDQRRLDHAANPAARSAPSTRVLSASGRECERRPALSA